MIFKLGELFSGPGGIGLASKNAQIRTKSGKYAIEHVWATDYDKDSCRTFRENICPDKLHTVICKDIRKLDFSLLKEISEIDALAFGFPCNDFSMVGERRGIDGVFGPLYSYGVRALEYFKPKWFLAENVGGLKNANQGKAFGLILNELFNAGYSIYPHLYKFNEYGVPQTRQRIIIVGIRSDIEVLFRIPSPAKFRDVDISCRNAIENPPIESNSANHELTKQSEQVVKRLKHIKPGQNAFTANLPADLQLNIIGAKISQIYKRLDPLKPAYTITGSGGGGTHVYHWKENRALTNRERARLQTFPDDFVFHGSKESVRKQIGMAVPPRGMKIILTSLLKAFAGLEYPYIEPNISPMMHEPQLFHYEAVYAKQLAFFEKKVNRYKAKRGKYDIKR